MKTFSNYGLEDSHEDAMNSMLEICYIQHLFHSKNLSLPAKNGYAKVKVSIKPEYLCKANLLVSMDVLNFKEAYLWTIFSIISLKVGQLGAG